MDDVDGKLQEIEDRIARLPKPRQREFVDVRPTNPNAGDVHYLTETQTAEIFDGEKWVRLAATFEPVYEFGSTQPVAWIRREA